MLVRPHDSDARWATVLGAAVGLCYLAFLSPAIYAVDGISMLAVAESLVRHGSFAVAEGLGPLGRGGHYYSQWYPLQSLLAVPFVAVGLGVAALVGLSGHYVAAACALILPPVLTAVTVALVARLALRMGAGRTGALTAALAFAFGTIALAYARSFFAEPLLACLTAGALFFAFGASRRDHLAAGACAALAVLAKPSGVVVGAVLFFYLWARHRRLAASLAPALGTATGIALYAGYNVYRFGSPFAFGPPWLFTPAAVLTGLAGLLISPGFGVLWYSPVALLGVAGYRAIPASGKLEARAVAAVALAYLGLYGCWEYWAGGWSWGPRFLLPALPGALALAAFLAGGTRRLLLALAVVGFVVNAPTLVSYYERYFQETAELNAPDRDLTWSVRWAPVVGVWGSAGRELRDAAHADVRQLVREAGPRDTSVASSQLLRVVAVWWWMLPAAHIPRWLGALAAALMVGMGLAMLGSVYRARAMVT